jgi:hypothetical protein
MADLNHVYASDFGLDFDSPPFFTDAGVLQVPVHPFSPERLTIYKEDAGLGSPGALEILHHYLVALERQVALRRPAHLYGHPEVLGRVAPSVLPELFSAAARLGLPNMTVEQFARWWIERDRAELTLLRTADGTVEIETTGEAVEVRSATARRVVLEGTTHALAPMRWTVLPRKRETDT